MVDILVDGDLNVESRSKANHRAAILLWRRAPLAILVKCTLMLLPLFLAHEPAGPFLDAHLTLVVEALHDLRQGLPGQHLVVTARCAIIEDLCDDRRRGELQKRR